jgi:hypothetical protein
VIKPTLKVVEENMHDDVKYHITVKQLGGLLHLDVSRPTLKVVEENMHDDAESGGSDGI